MTHERQVIREKVVSVLQAGLPSPLNTSVSETPETPLIKDANGRVVQICVFTVSEKAKEDAYLINPREYIRILDLSIELYCNVTPVDDSLDTMAQLVELLLHEDPTLGGVCQDLRYRSTEISFEVDGERLLGVAILNYDVEYETGPIDVFPDLDWFNRAYAEYNLDGEQALADRSATLGEIRPTDTGPT